MKAFMTVWQGRKKKTRTNRRNSIEIYLRPLFRNINHKFERFENPWHRNDLKYNAIFVNILYYASGNWG